MSRLQPRLRMPTTPTRQVREVVRWLQMSDSRLASLAAQETVPPSPLRVRVWSYCGFQVHVVADHDMEAFGTPFDSVSGLRRTASLQCAQYMISNGDQGCYTVFGSLGGTIP